MADVREVRDDLGAAMTVPEAVRRVVSLVPSLTETIAVTAPELLVGATAWCSRPADLDVPRVRGTKNPDLDHVRRLAPDLVLANQEENRERDVRTLRAAGIPVWVTAIQTVEQAFTSLDRLLTRACGLPRPSWLEAARRVWSAPAAGPVRRAAAVVWRRPWMVVGRDTFSGDVLARLGLVNVYAAHPERYPRVEVEDILAADPDVVVLPDEPYAFSPADGPECFPDRAVALVSGRHLTWYGPSLVEARPALEAQLSATTPGTPHRA